MFKKLKTSFHSKKKHFLTNKTLSLTNLVGRSRKAIDSTLAKLSNLTKTNYRLGLFHLAHNNLSDATLRFKLLTLFNKNHAEYHYLLAKSLFLQEKYAQAKLSLTKTLQLEPNHIKGKYLLEKITAPEKIQSIPPLYIHEKNTLEDLLYIETISSSENTMSPSSQKIKIILEQLVKQLPEDKKSYDILELGCGKGENSQYIQDALPVKTLTGIDISEKRIDIARQKSQNSQGTYDQLLATEAHCFLEKNTQYYDLITAINTINYLSSPEVFFQSVSTALKDQGMLIICITPTPQKTSALDLKKDIFKHNVTTITDALKNAGLEEKKVKNIQEENTNPTTILLIYKKKPPLSS